MRVTGRVRSRDGGAANRCAPRWPALAERSAPTCGASSSASIAIETSWRRDLDVGYAAAFPVFSQSLPHS
eukprot:scaffold63949_cov61-Phaeocystis_antarctica.AAC.1